MKKYVGVMMFLGLSSTGCTELTNNPYFSEFMPSISFGGLQVNEVSFKEVDTEFLFDIHNPNPIGIDIEDFSYSLAFADVDWMDGNNPDGLLLNPSGDSTVSLPSHIVFSELYDMVQASRGLDSLPFGIAGDFGLRMDGSTLFLDEASTSQSSDSEVVYLPYDASGEFPALRKPSISFDKIKIKDLSWSQIKLNLVLDVDNEHASNLIFQRFSYDLELAGNSVVSGIADNLEEIVHGEEEQGSRNRKVRIPITIDSLSAISSLWDVFSGGGRLNAQFKALSDVDTPFGLMELEIDQAGNVDVEMQ
jgi:LEA14-like dessication related protein